MAVLLKKQTREGMSQEDKDLLKSLNNSDTHNSGLYNSNLAEATPKYNSTDSETVLPSSSPVRGPAHYIIMGRDRPRGTGSGYGGAGYTHCATIDLVAGLSGPLAREVNENNELIYTDKSPELDSARVYISQKTDVDKNFNLTDGMVGNAIGKSAVAIKADAVRLIARDGIKLVTGTDTYDGQGVRIGVQGGIDLIAGNAEEGLQPLVKGMNLLVSMEELVDLVVDMNGIMTKLVGQYFMLVNGLLIHTHIATGPGAPTSPSPDFPATAISQYNQLSVLMFDLAMHQKNTIAWKLDFTTPTGDLFINSIHNNTN